MITVYNGKLEVELVGNHYCKQSWQLREGVVQCVSASWRYPWRRCTRALRDVAQSAHISSAPVPAEPAQRDRDTAPDLTVTQRQDEAQLKHPEVLMWETLNVMF